MKKLLMPIFGGILLTSSASLTTAQNTNTAIKLVANKHLKNQDFLNKEYLFNQQSNLTFEQIQKIKFESQTWNTQQIDNILNKALQYVNNKLIINQSKLDASKLPIAVLQYINLSLNNLNNAVSAGFIKVSVINDLVQLIYPENNTSKSLRSMDNDIIELGGVDSNKHFLASNGISMWITAYGPSHWWRFWEWEDYVHFNDAFVNIIFKWAKIVCELLSIPFLLANLVRIDSVLSILSAALKANNVNLISESLKELSEILGNINLDFLGKASDILATIAGVIAFGYALQTAESILSGGVLEVAITLLLSGIVWMSDSALNVNRGNGVKWQWANFIIPVGFFAE